MALLPKGGMGRGGERGNEALLRYLKGASKASKVSKGASKPSKGASTKTLQGSSPKTLSMPGKVTWWTWKEKLLCHWRTARCQTSPFSGKPLRNWLKGIILANSPTLGCRATTPPPSLIVAPSVKDVYRNSWVKQVLLQVVNSTTNAWTVWSPHCSGHNPGAYGPPPGSINCLVAWWFLDLPGPWVTLTSSHFLVCWPFWEGWTTAIELASNLRRSF